MVEIKIIDFSGWRYLPSGSDVGKIIRSIDGLVGTERYECLPFSEIDSCEKYYRSNETGVYMLYFAEFRGERAEVCLTVASNLPGERSEKAVLDEASFIRGSLDSEIGNYMF